MVKTSTQALLMSKYTYNLISYTSKGSALKNLNAGMKNKLADSA